MILLKKVPAKTRTISRVVHGEGIVTESGSYAGATRTRGSYAVHEKGGALMGRPVR